MNSLSNRANGVVVFLHSSMSSKAQWNRIIKILDPRLTPIAIDLHGYGSAPSPCNPEKFSLSTEVELVLHTVNQRIGTDAPFHLVGHSYGGAVSLRLAYENPQRIASLALYEPVAFHLLNPEDPAYVEVQTLIHKIGSLIEAGDRVRATEVFIDYWSGNGSFNDMTTEIQSMLVEQVDKVQLDFYALMNDTLRLLQLQTFTFPVCLMKGNSSPQSSSQVANEIKRTLRNVTCHEVDGGHMAPITKAFDVNLILQAFLHEQSGVLA